MQRCYNEYLNNCGFTIENCMQADYQLRLVFTGLYLISLRLCMGDINAIMTITNSCYTEPMKLFFMLILSCILQILSSLLLRVPSEHVDRFGTHNTRSLR